MFRSGNIKIKSQGITCQKNSSFKSYPGFLIILFTDFQQSLSAINIRNQDVDVFSPNSSENSRSLLRPAGNPYAIRHFVQLLDRYT